MNRSVPVRDQRATVGIDAGACPPGTALDRNVDASTRVGPKSPERSRRPVRQQRASPRRDRPASPRHVGPRRSERSRRRIGAPPAASQAASRVSCGAPIRPGSPGEADWGQAHVATRRRPSYKSV
jgi:hypothetical protein